MGSLAVPDAVLDRARRVGREIGRLAAGVGGQVSVDADQTLAGRAAMLGIAPAGRISAGGATRLLASRDGWCALTLSRPDDVDAIPALLEVDRPPAEPWQALAAAVAARGAADVVERARLLDLPAAVLGEVSAAAPAFVSRGRPAPRAVRELLVADLSSMWAGPLCGSLLAAAGATVVKVESPGRPDGTRRGHPDFFDWMNSAKLSYAADFGGDETRLLLEVADVVIEGSRPAALVRRRLGPDDIPPRPGQVWLRVTGYGTHGRCADRVAFGDDAAVAGGLVGEGPVFVGDAIADPLTGLEAARAVFEALGRGGGELVEVAMAEVAASYATGASLRCANCVPAEPPPPRRPAAALGADNGRVRELIESRLSRC